MFSDVLSTHHIISIIRLIGVKVCTLVMLNMNVTLPGLQFFLRGSHKNAN